MITDSLVASRIQTLAISGKGLTKNERELLDFMTNYESDDFDAMLEAFKEEASIFTEATERQTDNILYFLSRIGLITLDINASRSRFFVVGDQIVHGQIAGIR